MSGAESLDQIAVPANWRVNFGEFALSDGAQALFDAESQTPVSVSPDLSLRAKIIDSCGLTCQFCHNEGTPVASDNPESVVVIRGVAGQSGRVSVFSDYNGVDFVPGLMDPADPAFRSSLEGLKDELGYEELHLTGGEPTLHRDLPAIVRLARDVGYKVIMTSNGEKGHLRIAEAVNEGLAKINFSIFGTTPGELAEVQAKKFQDVVLAQKKIDALQESIALAADLGVDVAANIVMSGPEHEDRIVRLIEEYDSRLDLRVLHDLSKAQESAAAVYEMLARLGAKPISTAVEAGSAGVKVRYELPGGRTIVFKQIRPTRLDECAGCSLNNPDDCAEGFYGTRLYVDTEGQYKVGVCLQRMDLTSNVDRFIGSSLSRQVVALREREQEELKDQLIV